ncbi:MAG TPA: alpha/beta hydrolase [Caulobacteraceae bacterium]|nr:alpha/beta hydrolase [Caulobacteraceae bacterium]
MPFAQLSRVRLEYFPHGDGPERVVFIHGFQASAPIWRMTQEALPPDRYSSIAINNRGAGASEAPADEADFGCEVFADDAFELVSQLGWKDFTLVGHSMGGATVAAFAVKHPGLLRGLVLLDPADPDGRMRDAPIAEVDAAIDRAVSALIARRDAARPGEGIDARGVGAPPELMRQLDADMRAAPERRLRGSMRSMMTLRLGERVKSLPMPVLLAGGDADELIPVAAMLATWAKYPTGTGLCLWHGVGHSPNLDCPSELAALLRRFIEVTIPARAKAPAA